MFINAPAATCNTTTYRWHDTWHNRYFLRNMGVTWAYTKQLLYVIYDSLDPCFIVFVIVWTTDFRRVTKFCFFVQAGCFWQFHRLIILSIVFHSQQAYFWAYKNMSHQEMWMVSASSYLTELVFDFGKNYI